MCPWYTPSLPPSPSCPCFLSAPSLIPSLSPWLLIPTSEPGWPVWSPLSGSDPRHSLWHRIQALYPHSWGTKFTASQPSPQMGPRPARSAHSNKCQTAGVRLLLVTGFLQQGAGLQTQLSERTLLSPPGYQLLTVTWQWWQRKLNSGILVTHKGGDHTHHRWHWGTRGLKKHTVVPVAHPAAWMRKMETFHLDILTELCGSLAGGYSLPSANSHPY